MHAMLVVQLLILNVASQYRLVSELTNSTTIILGLSYTGPADSKDDNYILRDVSLILQCRLYAHLTVKLTDTSRERFEIPEGPQPFFPSPYRSFSFPLSLSAATVTYSSDPFNLVIRRRTDQSLIFSTTTLLLSNHYLEIGTQLDSQYLYGLGERFSVNFKLKPGKWTMFNVDRGEQMDDGEGYQQYGYFPMYLMRETNFNFHIVYLRNSNAMDVITARRNNRNYLTFKTIGGVIDLRFFIGGLDPQPLLESFHAMFGRAQVPSFWSMGWHQSRYGYQNIAALQNVIANYSYYRIPLDTIWCDIQYLIGNEMFTIDETKFPLSGMRDILNSHKLVPIISGGIKVQGVGPAYQQGLKRNVFIRDGSSEHISYGRLRAGQVAYVDFLHPNASSYWFDMLQYLYDKLPFSGIWLDENQFTNFCQGPCDPPNPSFHTYDYNEQLPYVPGMQPIEQAQLSLNSTHYNKFVEADIHVYEGLMETYETFKFLLSKGNLKPFILSRSSTFGLARFGIHWTGDNQASFKYLRNSILDNFNHMLFGNMIVGADICGYSRNTTEQLCARWYQLGSMYPFSRSHNHKGDRDQEPYSLGPVVLQAATNNIRLRYALLKHYYSLLMLKNGLGSIFKPVFWVFPQYPQLYEPEISETQFMIGDELMAAPIVYPNTTQRQVYFPAGRWVDLHSGRAYQGQTTIYDVSLTSKIPLFLPEGALVLMQTITADIQKTTHLTNAFQAYISLQRGSNTSTDAHYSAEGKISSLSNYSNDVKVAECSRSSCSYRFITSMTVNNASGSKQLTVKVEFNGDASVREQIVVDEWILWSELGEDRIKQRVVINNSMSFAIPIKVISAYE